MPPTANNYVLCLAVLLGGVLLIRHLRGKRLPLPPGPFRWPIIGSALQVPKTYAWLTYSKWAKTYGDIVYLKVFGQSIYVVNSARIAKDLLDKRSVIYSSRPHLTMCTLSSFDQTTPILPYGEEWRQSRKLMAQGFTPSNVLGYHALQENEARRLVLGGLRDSSTMESQIKVRIATIILRVTYGYLPENEDDAFLVSALSAMEAFSAAVEPGAWLVDLLPWLRHIPTWMPGAGFHTTAAAWRKKLSSVSRETYLWTKNNLDTGVTLLPNICVNIMSSSPAGLSETDERRLTYALVSAFGGGLDTNISTVLSFFLYMCLHPSIQARARSEIDSVIGMDRLPSINDRDSLPFVRSVIAEVFRRAPALPLGLAHALNKDDDYNGIYVPKDSIIVPNIWHMFHDPDVYENPMEFNPDRYGNVDAEIDKVTDLIFGFGRRVCPGMHLAEGTVFAIVSTALATCEILPALNANGEAIQATPTYTSGTIVFPESFGCRLKVRSEKALALLSEASPTVPL